MEEEVALIEIGELLKQMYDRGDFCFAAQSNSEAQSLAHLVNLYLDHSKDSGLAIFLEHVSSHSEREFPYQPPMNRHPIARLLTHAARWTALSGSSVKAVLDAAHCFSLETPNGLGPIEGGSDSGTFPALGSEHKFDIAPLSSLRLSRLKELTLNSNFLSQPLGKLVVKDERLRSLQSLIVFTPSRTPAHRSRTLHRFISPMKKLERLELQLTYATSSMEDVSGCTRRYLTRTAENDMAELPQLRHLRLSRSNNSHRELHLL